MKEEELLASLNYLNMQEIKSFCNKHAIPISGKKGEILKRIVHYVNTGKILKPKIIPEISKAKVGETYPLKPDVLILKNNYKNDLKTRNFMKKLVGNHFHFTAFGQDWILEQWLKGKPPTYQAFANAWQKEYLKRKNTKANPKKEWAYLNFIQQYVEKNPRASRKTIAAEWEKERLKQVKKVMAILDSCSADA